MDHRKLDVVARYLRWLARTFQRQNPGETTETIHKIADALERSPDLDGWHLEICRPKGRPGMQTRNYRLGMRIQQLFDIDSDICKKKKRGRPSLKRAVATAAKEFGLPEDGNNSTARAAHAAYKEAIRTGERFFIQNAGSGARRQR
jgi:hypothetical protein